MQLTVRSAAKFVFGWSPADSITSETAWLNGMRGLASFLVMMSHYSYAFETFIAEAPFGATIQQDMAYDNQVGGASWYYYKGQRLWAPSRLPVLRVFFTNGGGQVAIFFVISGFVLTYNMLGLAHAGNFSDLYSSLGSSAFRRWLRLFWPCVPVTYIYAVKANFDQTETSFWAMTWLYLWQAAVWMNPLQTFQEHRNHEFQFLNNVVWTIPYEFNGSICVFLLVLMLGRMRYHRRLFLMTVAIVMACLSLKWHLILFIVGMALADYTRHFNLLSKRPDAPQSWARTASLIAVLLLGLAIMSFPTALKDYYDTPGYEWDEYLPYPPDWRKDVGSAIAWWGLGACLTVTSACHLPGMRSFFELSFLQYLGKLSFMFYLIHVMIGNEVGMRIQRLGYMAVCTYEDDPAFKMPICKMNIAFHFMILVVTWILTVPVVLVAAHILETSVDRPITQLGKKIDTLLLRDWAWRGAVVEDEVEKELLLEDSDELELDELPLHERRVP